MTRINTNVSSLIAQNRLTSSNASLQSSLNRLSTGLRINSGADDPAGIIASEALRSQITGLGKAVSNTKRTSQIISTADGALGQVGNLLGEIRGLITEASSSGGISENERAANQLQIDSSLEAINRISQTTTFQGRKLLDGSLDFITSEGSGATNLNNLQISKANLGSTESLSVDINIKTAATQAAIDVAGFNAATSLAPASGTLTFSFDTNVYGPTDTVSFTLTSDTGGSAGNGPTLSVIESTGHGTSPTAAVDGSGNVTLTVDDNAYTPLSSIETELNNLAGFNVTRVDSGSNPSNFNPAVDPSVSSATFAGGTDEEGGGVSADVVFQLSGIDGVEVFNVSQGTTLDQLKAQINLVSDATGVTADSNGTTLELRSSVYGSESFVDLEVISEEAGGNFGAGTRSVGTDVVVSVNGTEAHGSGNHFSINSSALSLSANVEAGFTGTAAVEVTGGGAAFQLGPDLVSNQQARLGIGSVSTSNLGGVSGRLYQLGSGETAALGENDSLATKIIAEAIDQVSGFRGQLGAFQATTLESNITSLSEALANLRSAESSIRDADFAQESAKLTRAQILVQSGTNVLSLANQNPRNVLSFLT